MEMLGGGTVIKMALDFYLLIILSLLIVVYFMKNGYFGLKNVCGEAFDDIVLRRHSIPGNTDFYLEPSY
jgi:hypothetical protein